MTDTPTPTLQTPFRKEKEAREKTIYEEYNRMMGEPGAQATAVNDFIMKKYGIYSVSTLYNIRKRVESQLKAEKGGLQ